MTTQSHRAVDGTRIDIEQRWEVAYWCEELRCTERQLREVVFRVGALVVDVRRALGRR